MPRLQWLRYGKRHTGFQVTVTKPAVVIVGLRWSNRVFNAGPGPFIEVVPKYWIGLKRPIRWRRQETLAEYVERKA